MIYLISKTKYQISNIKYPRQAGVTLLLAILILSSVLAISFSLATILFIEVRTSGDLLKTEPAYYAATGVGEQALFNLERHTCSSDGHDCSYTSNFNNSAVLNGFPTVQSTSPATITDKVKAGSTFANTLNKYDFCDVTAWGSGCNYGRVTVSYITTNSNSSPLYVYLCEFKTSFSAPAGSQDSGHYATVPCTDTSLINSQAQSYWNITPTSLVGTYNYSGPNAGSFTLIPNGSIAWTLTPAMQQQLILTNPTTNNAADIYVKIQTYADSVGNSPKGLPFVGKTAVNINTTNAAVGRKIQVIVPNTSNGASVNVTNYAASSNGGVASASTEFSNGQFPASSAINGDRKGVGWGGGTGGWNDNTAGDWSNDWLAVAFSGPKNLSDVDVYSLADTIPLASNPNPSDTFTLYGLTNFEIQYSVNNGANWTDVPGGNITGNNLVWKKVAFSAIANVTNIRVLVHNSLNSYSRIVELEAY